MRNRLSDRQVSFALALYSLGLAVWLLVAQVRVTQEDGFYYFKIAQNVAQGAGSTFDGLHLTNGYHPLWLWCLVPIFWLTSSPAAALQLGTILQGLLMATSAGLLYFTARLRFGRPAASLAALLWVMWLDRVSLGGVEFSLHALGVIASAYVYLRWFSSEQPPSSTAYFGLGCLLSLTFLARLDTILLTGVIGLFLMRREFQLPSPHRRLRWPAFGLPVVITGLAYLVSSLWLFGHPFPVSGLIKRDWSAYLLAHDPVYRSWGWWAAKAHLLLWPMSHLRPLQTFYLAFGSVGLGGLRLMGAWSDWLRRTLRPWEPFILFSLLNLFGYVWLYHSDLSFTTWYYVMQPWLVVMFAAALFDVLSQRRQVETRHGASLHCGRWDSLIQWAGRLGLAILWCSVPLATLRGLEQWIHRERLGLDPEPLRDAAQWARVNLPAASVIGAWNAGAIGYLSERRVVNLDGVVNSWEYYQTERYDLCRYWPAAGVTYLVDVFEDHQALSVVPTYPAYARCADRLEFIWADHGYGPAWYVAVYRILPSGS